MLNNRTFYPTPEKLSGKMIGRIQGDPGRILEPSAGKGDLVEGIMKRYERTWRRLDVWAIESDINLQATLRGKGIRVIDTDFLSFSGPDKFDTIIANPPFDEGDKHLLKAIDIMYRGQIVFLLNAETIRNPCTNTRKELVKKLDELKADVEYIQGAFRDAERPTGVEVALVYIKIERDVEDDLFAGVDDKTVQVSPDLEQNHELTTGRDIEDLVAEYNQVVGIGIDTIVGYFRNYRKIGKYLGLNKEADDYRYSTDSDMTTKMQSHVNALLASVRTDFWRRALDLDEVRSRLTSKKRDEFETQIKDRCDMDFTAGNVRQFVLNLIRGYEKTLTDAVLDAFNKLTVRHCYSDGLYDDNIHYFTGWKTNKAFRVNRRVIIPIYGSMGGPFRDWSGGWKLDYKAAGELGDLDIVMNYFDGRGNYLSLSSAIDAAFQRGQTSKIRSTYFTATCYKKGTIHLTFNDENILRRFNVVACRGKEWLPHDYGTKPYNTMDPEERAVVDSFEGAFSYTENLGKPLFAAGATVPRLSAA